MKLINITNELNLKKVSHEELISFIPYNNHRTETLKNSDGSNKRSCRIIYGNDDLFVTYKSKTREIIKVEYYDRAENKELISSFVNNINKYLVNNEGEEEIVTNIVFSYKNDILEFNFDNKFQFCYVPEGSPYPKYLASEFPYLIQYKYIKTNHISIDSIRRDKKLKEILYILSSIAPIVLDTMIFNPILNRSKYMWVYPDIVNIENFKPVSEYRQIGYTFYSESFKYNCFKPIGESSNEFYSIQIEKIKDIFRIYFLLNEKNKNIFLNACYWFHKATIADSLTSKFLYLIIMIESFLPTDAEKCDSCGQDKYKVSQKFKDFVKKYSGISDNSLLNDLYSLRSKIAHNALVIGRIDKGFSSSLIPVDINEEDDSRYFYKVCSYILINWLNTNFKEKTL